jgi:hypothetical protein
MLVPSICGLGTLGVMVIETACAELGDGLKIMKIKASVVKAAVFNMRHPPIGID